MHRRRVVAWVIIIMSLAVFVPSITIVNATAGTPVQGSIVVDTVWDITGSPYWVVDNVTVSAGATLTIESGVEVLFDGKYDIVVFGSFLVLGERDDEILLDYNTTTSPMAKHWMIDLRPGGSLRLSHAVIKHGGIIADQSKDFVIENSEISNSSWSIHMYNVDGAQILANHIHDIDDHAISAWQGSDNGTLNNNRFDDNNGVVAHLWQAKNWRIENNTFRGGGACLFVTGSLENITLAQNEVSECGMGISATLLSDLILLNNYVHHNTNGMLANSNPMRVEGNTLCQNSNNNLEVRGGNGVVVKRNHITHGYRGILIGGFLAEFTENFIAYNDYGMYLANASHHRIHHNYFLSNTHQAYVNRIISPRINFWNETYPSGGNYWSDYTGMDVYSGPNQNVPGSDGIGDTNYTIPEANNDSYPLMSPPFELIPDLQIAPEDIRFIPESPVAPGTMVTINITIRNKGWDDAQDVSVAVYMGHPSNHMLIGGGTIPHIAPVGWREFLETEWPPPSAGDYDIWVVLDEMNVIPESNESNNEAFRTITVEWPSLIDLRVDSSDIFFDPPSPVDNGTIVNMSATVFNDGSADALDVLVRFYDNVIQPANQIGGDVVIPVIPVGGSEVASVQWTASPPGSHDIWVYVDPLDSIGETNELNNQASAAMHVVSTSPLRPPALTDAALAGAFLQDVLLSWELSPDDANGSVDRYDIFRGASFSAGGSGYVLQGSVQNGTSSYLDAGAGEGDPTSHFYQVCAMDSYNNTSCSSIQAAKFTRPLTKGPNLVSTPLVQSDESIETVLQTVKHDKAWHYDSSSQEWKWHMTSKGYSRGLWNVNHTMGIWVNVTENSNLTVAGIVPAQTTIHLYEGWNLVSFPSFNTTYTVVADLKASVPVERVEAFDQLSMPHFLRVAQDGDVLLAGEAYWVKVSEDTTWVVSIV